MGQRNSKKGRSGDLHEKHKELCQAKYIKGRNGNDIRAEIKGTIEWGKHWVKDVAGYSGNNNSLHMRTNVLLSLP